MTGYVRRIEDFGAFVGLEGTRMSALLHVSNVSRRRFDYLEDVLQTVSVMGPLL